MSYISMIAPVASKLLDYIFPPITNQFGYLFHHNKNVNNIRELLEKLQDKRSRVEGGYIAKRNGELIESDVERWLTEVGEIVEKLGKFLEDDTIGEKMSCFNVCFSFNLSEYDGAAVARRGWEGFVLLALLSLSL
ncbi:hypothetical protein CsSME_00047345 [Camellia sinensis var. sinensis]